MLDRDYVYLFVHSLLYFECLSHVFHVMSTPHFNFWNKKMGQSVFKKNIKFAGFGFLTKCLFCSFCEQSVQSFRLIGYCFLLLLGVMIRKCLQMLSCTNPIQASSGPQYLREDKKKILRNGSLPACLGFFFFYMMRRQWTCSKQLLRKKNKCSAQYSAILCRPHFTDG